MRNVTSTGPNDRSSCNGNGRCEGRAGISTSAKPCHHNGTDADSGPRSPTGSFPGSVPNHIHGAAGKIRWEDFHNVFEIHNNDCIPQLWRMSFGHQHSACWLRTANGLHQDDNTPGWDQDNICVPLKAGAREAGIVLCSYCKTTRRCWRC